MTATNPRRSAIILVVEDEPIQRLDMVDVVEAAGFEAVEAYDADHAITILENRPDIRVVFTDIDMPGSMNGLRLAAAIRSRWPPIEIIVSTAGRAPALDDLPARAVFFSKPLNYDRVIGAMRQMACQS